MLKVLNHNHQYMAAALRSGDESDLAPSLAQPMKDIALPSPSRIRKSAVSSTKETRQVLSPQSAESDVPTLKPSTKKEVPLNTDPVTRFMADASQYLLFTPEREREIGRALMAARTGYLGELLESLPISIYALNVLGRVLGKVPDGKLRADRHLIFKQNEGKAALAKGELSYKTVKALLDRIAQALPTTLDQSLTPDCQLQAKRRIDHSKVVVRTLLEEVRFSDKVVRDFIDRFRTLVSQSESRLAKDSSQSEVQKVFNELGESLESAKERLSRIDEYLHCYREAREDVVKSNLRMVVSIAKNWTGNGISMEDLIGYGMPGLWRAAEKFDVVLNMEVIEHVADPALFLAECAAMVKPGGLMFIATINRTMKAWALAIIAAENVLRWLPKAA